MALTWAFKGSDTTLLWAAAVKLLLNEEWRQTRIPRMLTLGQTPLVVGPQRTATWRGGEATARGGGDGVDPDSKDIYGWDAAVVGARNGPWGGGGGTAAVVVGSIAV